MRRIAALGLFEGLEQAVLIRPHPWAPDSPRVSRGLHRRLRDTEARGDLTLGQVRGAQRDNLLPNSTRWGGSNRSTTMGRRKSSRSGVTRLLVNAVRSRTKCARSTMWPPAPPQLLRVRRVVLVGENRMERRDIHGARGAPGEEEDALAPLLEGLDSGQLHGDLSFAKEPVAVGPGGGLIELGDPRRIDDVAECRRNPQGKEASEQQSFHMLASKNQSGQNVERPVYQKRRSPRFGVRRFTAAFFGQPQVSTHLKKQKRRNSAALQR